VTALIVAALVWIGVHVGLSGTRLRQGVVARIGETGFRGAFSLVSIAAIVFLVRAWSVAATEPLWFAPNWLRWVLVLAMLVALLLFVASVSRPNPTMVGPAGAAGRPPRGMTRVTRHPMLWSFAIWAAVHVIGNGDSASVIFFGAFLVTALAGMPSIVPFAAITAGRNRFVPREIGWMVPLIAIVAWVALLWLHPLLFGVPPVAW